MRDQITTQVFSQIDAFRLGVQSICGAYDIDPIARTFAARAGIARRGGLELASLAVSSVTVRRDETASQRDRLDHFVLTLQQSGHTKMMQNDQVVLLRPGDMFLSDATRPSCFAFNGEVASQLSVHLPRAAVLSRLGRMTQGGHCLRRENSLAIAMTALLSRAQEKHPPRIDETFVSLLGIWHEDRAAAPPDAAAPETTAPEESLLSMALAMIELHCADPDFGSGTLADLLDVSPRKLQRAFAPLCESPRDRILATRLENARRDLAQRGDRTILDVALAQGFGDLSHFYHVFKARFGYAPGTIRSHSPSRLFDA